jgi:hypothetical protein
MRSSPITAIDVAGAQVEQGDAMVRRELLDRGVERFERLSRGGTGGNDAENQACGEKQPGPHLLHPILTRHSFACDAITIRYEERLTNESRPGKEP